MNGATQHITKKAYERKYKVKIIKKEVKYHFTAEQCRAIKAAVKGKKRITGVELAMYLFRHTTYTAYDMMDFFNALKKAQK